VTVVPDDRLEERLRQVIDLLCEDAALVELWACALSGFAQPVPGYGPARKDRFDSLPG
jgi:hypothetical protein